MYVDVLLKAKRSERKFAFFCVSRLDFVCLFLNDTRERGKETTITFFFIHLLSGNMLMLKMLVDSIAKNMTIKNGK